MPQRALLTAIGMLVVNEAFSSALLDDLAARATEPAIAAVLATIRGDEAGHATFGLRYVRVAVDRFDGDVIPYVQTVLQQSAEAQLAAGAPLLEAIPPERRRLESHPEPELARWGLMSPVREALVKREAWRARLQPALAAFDLAVAPRGA